MPMMSPEDIITNIKLEATDEASPAFERLGTTVDATATKLEMAAARIDAAFVGVLQKLDVASGANGSGFQRLASEAELGSQKVVTATGTIDKSLQTVNGQHGSTRGQRKLKRCLCQTRSRREDAKSGIGSAGSVATISGALALAMHNWAIGPKGAMTTMDVLHSVAAYAGGGTTVEKLSANMGKSSAEAALTGISIPQWGGDLL